MLSLLSKVGYEDKRSLGCCNAPLCRIITKIIEIPTHSLVAAIRSMRLMDPHPIKVSIQPSKVF